MAAKKVSLPPTSCGCSVAGKTITLGFTGEARSALEKAL